MDVFQLCNRLIGDCASCISSFIMIRDEKIRQHVDESRRDDLLWTEALIQLNPSFESGDRVDDPTQLIRETLAIEREIANGLEQLLQEIEVTK